MSNPVQKNYPLQSIRKLLPLLLCFVFLPGCGADPDQAAAPVMAVQVTDSIRRDFPLTIELVGSTFGNQDVPIRARVEGFLLSVDFREGRMVSKGDLLYTIDPQPFQAKVIEAQSALAAEQTRLVKAEADLARIKPLAEMRAVSEQDLDSSVAQEAAARASVKAAEARVELAEIERGYCQIYAPIDGLIGLTKAKPGEFVGREPNPVVLNTLSDIEPIRVRFSISEREYLVLARGYQGPQGGRRVQDETSQAAAEAPMQLILADGSEYKHIGYVDGSSQSIDPSTGTFSLEATFPNPNGLLLPGQFARIRAPYKILKDAVIVPKQAVIEFQGRFQVYVVNADDIVELLDVTPGPAKGYDIVIEAGLSEGQTVIVEGIQKVRPGMKVLPSPYIPPVAPQLLEAL
jgi:membrane fusion protein (multidrug efflux system)